MARRGGWRLLLGLECCCAAIMACTLRIAPVAETCPRRSDVDVGRGFPYPAPDPGDNLPTCVRWEWSIVSSSDWAKRFPPKSYGHGSVPSDAAPLHNRPSTSAGPICAAVSHGVRRSSSRKPAVAIVFPQLRIHSRNSCRGCRCVHAVCDRSSRIIISPH